jgi:hypothetical protein
MGGFERKKVSINYRDLFCYVQAEAGNNEIIVK